MTSLGQFATKADGWVAPTTAVRPYLTEGQLYALETDIADWWRKLQLCQEKKLDLCGSSHLYV